MQIVTSRFGTVDVQAADFIRMPHGLLGEPGLREWVLLADRGNEALGWLQSAHFPHVALALVNPCRFVPDYQFRVGRGNLAVLSLQNVDQLQVLVIVSRQQEVTSLNLRAPLLFNLQAQLAAQVVTKDEHPVQFALSHLQPALRKTA